MSQFNKEKIEIVIKKNLSNHNFICSTTIVGSFNDFSSLSSVSDIDIVVIIDKIDENKYNLIINSIKNIQPDQLGLSKFSIKVNPTFGPLKFDSPDLIIFHLMIYDIEGHINHVEKSPFTCLDWELAKPIIGFPLKKIYPVLFVKLDDLVKSRRGLESYLNDIKNNKISYREYSFVNGECTLILKNKKLEKKDSLEYSYHISKNLFLNLFKILTQTNSKLKPNKLISFFNDFRYDLSFELNLLKELSNWKHKGSKAPENILLKMNDFIISFFDFLSFIENNSKQVSFYRHAKTTLNDGSFLGIHRDPDIIHTNKIKDNYCYDIGFSSNLQRAKSTLNFFSYRKTEIDDRLNEINYGLVEGKNKEYIEKNYNYIIKGWNNREDPRFPKGENQKDVSIRVKAFLEDLNNRDDFNSVLIITHLVFLRVMMHIILNISLWQIHKIQIYNLEKIDVLIFKKRIIPSFSHEIRKRIRENFKNES